MTHTDSLHPDFDRYIDGLLEGDALAAFEQVFEADAELRQAVKDARSFDALVAQTFAPPSASDAVIDQILSNAINQDNQTTNSTVSVLDRPSSWVWIKTIAAMLLLSISAFLIWNATQQANSNNRYGPRSYQSMSDLYASAQSGTLDYWRCDSDREFITTFWQHLDQGLKLKSPLPSTIEAKGIGYSNTLTEHSMVFYAIVNREPVVLVIDRLQKDSSFEDHLAIDSTLQVHRLEMGGLVVYEVSPFDKPMLFGVIEAVDMPTEWIPGRRQSGLEEDGQ